MIGTETLSMVPPVFNFTFTSRYFNCTIPPTDGGEASGSACIATDRFFRKLTPQQER